MSAKQDGADYLLKLGLDTSRIDKQYPKVLQQLQRGVNSVTAAQRRQLDLSTKNLVIKQKEIALAKRQATIERQIRAAEGRGAVGFGNIRTLAGKGDALSIARAELAVREKLLAFERKHRIEVTRRREEEARIAALARTERAARASRIAAERAARDPLGVTERSKVGLSTRIGHEINRSVPVSPQFSGAVADIRSQMQGLRAELNNATNIRQVTRIRERFRDLNAEMRRVVSEQRRFNNELTRANSLTQRFTTSFKSMIFGLGSAYAAAGAAKEIFRVGKEFDAMQASLLAASDSEAHAAENFKFLAKTAQELGTPIESGISGFNKLGIAMKGAGFSAEEIQQVYTSMQEGITTAQLSADRAGLVMLGISQMVSKGKVSSQELNQQIGEHLPFSLEAATTAMGVTTAELFKMMETGKLATKDFVIPYAEAISKIVRRNDALTKATQKLTSQQNRMVNAWKLTINKMFQEAGGVDFFSKIFKDVADGIEYAQPLILALSEILFGTLGTIWDIGKAIVNVTIDLAKFVGNLIGLKSGSAGLHVLLGDFYLIKAVIYGIIAAIYELKDTLTTGLQSPLAALKDKFNLDLGKVGKLSNSLPLRMLSNIAGSGGSTKTNVTVGNVTFNSPNADAKKVGEEFFSNFGLEVGLFQ
jgi:tape measure domain-containing protein